MEVPIAVPLRVPSMESRHNRYSDLDEPQEEMDIGAAAASAPLPRNHDLLGLGFPSPGEMPHGGRFQLGRTMSSDNTSVNPDAVHVPILSSSPSASYFDGSPAKQPPPPQQPHHTVGVNAPTAVPSKSYTAAINNPNNRMSYERSRSAGRRARGNSVTGLLFGTGNGGDIDDVEGDLGYSAATDMESSTRKVIVERLETVKANNPVFSWC